MLGYLANTRIGAILYNAVHTYILFPLPQPLTPSRPSTKLLLSLIWIAHIGFGRMLGYGLKYPTQFKDTHLLVNPSRHTF